MKVDIAALSKTETVEQVKRKDTLEKEPVGEETKETIDTDPKKIPQNMSVLLRTSIRSVLTRRSLLHE